MIIDALSIVIGFTFGVMFSLFMFYYVLDRFGLLESFNDSAKTTNILDKSNKK